METTWFETASSAQLIELLIWSGFVAAALFASFWHAAKQSDKLFDQRKDRRRFDEQMHRLVRLREFAEKRLEISYYPFDNRLGLMAFVSCLYCLENTYRELGLKASDEQFDFCLEKVLPLLAKQAEALTCDSTCARPRLVDDAEFREIIEQRKAG